jgi:hypothetical protein
MSAEEACKRFDELKTELGDTGVDLVGKFIPEKIASLGELAERIGGDVDEITGKDTQDGLSDKVQGYARELEAELIDMLGALGKLRVWLQLKMPRESDGDNFGVAVQATVLSMLTAGRVSGQSVLSDLYKYQQDRAGFVKEARRYPTVADFEACIGLFDVRQMVAFGQAASDLRDNYALLLDRIVKNQEKLLRPRRDTSNHMMML